MPKDNKKKYTAKTYYEDEECFSYLITSGILAGVGLLLVGASMKMFLDASRGYTVDQVDYVEENK